MILLHFINRSVQFVSIVVGTPFLHENHFKKMFFKLGYVAGHRPLTKGRITQQSSPERDEGNALGKNVFQASREGKKLVSQPKLEFS
jgi:hypothetical protein